MLLLLPLEATLVEIKEMKIKNVHYHGGPCWGKEIIGVDKAEDGSTVDIIKTCKEVLYKDSCALVSYERMDQLKYVLGNARSVMFDNGAFSDWKKLKKKGIVRTKSESLAHWDKYLKKVESIYDQIDWFFIPDVIGGTEEENDELISRVPCNIKDKAIPVWHSVESIERLVRLCEDFPYVGIGLCGPHEYTTSKPVLDRLTEAFTEIYINRSINVKIHGLRVLDGRVLGIFPFSSGDSSKVSTYVPKTEKKIPEVKCKLARTAVLKGAIESVYPPSIEDWVYSMTSRYLLVP